MSTFPQSEVPRSSGRCRRELDSRLKLPGPDYIAYIFVFLGSNITCRLYKLTLAVTLRLACLRFSVKIPLSAPLLWASYRRYEGAWCLYLEGKAR